MVKKLVSDRQKNKKRNAQVSSPVVRLWQGLSFWGGIAAVSGSVGVLSAFLLAATPLKNGSFHLGLPQNYGGLGSIIPATLTRPVNVLILGIDNSEASQDNRVKQQDAMAGNSDTMLLVRLVPDTHKIHVISIPRDTLVEIPGVGIDKINDANVKGGVELAEKTVSHLLSDLPIDYYVRLNTKGFIQLVDALGGVEVSVPKPMHYTDQTQKLFIDLQPGRQTLTGQHLQEYVRFRHDELGDIGRVQRQQDVLKAIVHSLLQPSTLGRLPQLLKVVKDNVDTDLSLGEVLGLAKFLATIDQHAIDLVMLPGRFSRQDEYPLSYWIENPEETALILSRYFNIPSETVQAIADTTFSRQLLRVAVFNATGQSGEAEKAKLFLRKQGFDNTYITTQEIDAVSVPVSETQIIAQQGNTEAAEAVKNALGLGQVQVASTGDIGSDITVVVGRDLAVPNLPDLVLPSQERSMSEFQRHHKGSI